MNINFLAVSVFNFSSNKNATRQIFNVLCTHMHTCYYAVYYIFYIAAGVRFFYVSIKCFSLTSFHSPKSHTYSHAHTHTLALHSFVRRLLSVMVCCVRALPLEWHTIWVTLLCRYAIKFNHRIYFIL